MQYFSFTSYKMITSNFSVTVLKATVYQILFTHSRVMQAVSLNGGKLAEKKHPLVTKSIVICLHGDFYCELLSPVL